jgi:nucleotide-binding universal stress UspA family protein
VERYPGVVYFGAGVLVWTAVKMINAEPLTKPWVAETPALAWLMYLAIPLVLSAGFLRNHRHLESRIHARLTAFKAKLPQGASGVAVAATAEPPLAQTQAMQAQAMPAEAIKPEAMQSMAAQTEAAQTEGELAMLKVLVPVDASPNALRAVRHAIAEYQRHHELELHLLNVQPRLSRHIARFVSRHDREVWHQDRADAAMAAATALLVQAGVPHVSHWAVGDRATQICASAQRLGAHHIVMSTARKNSLTRMLEDSTTNRVLENTPVPVEVVAGDAVSKWERWGLPVGVLGVAGGLVLWATE